ncbi:hypothetical protein [Corynebacterium sp. H130]|uniref:hypothetical protein n=1 Tax=Corynebacterium sp. H130 TaxID=3133444 RepID=UPI0030A2F7C2
MTDEKLRQLEYAYGLQRVQIKDPGLNAEIWAFRHTFDATTKLVTVCTVSEPQDYCITVLEPDLGAAVALLRVVLGRKDSPWIPGRVWLNDQPLLQGTAIQGLVVTEGQWSEIIALTEAEAELIARETLSAITITRARKPLAFCDLFRTNAMPEVSDEALSSITVFESKHSSVAPLRKIRAMPYHRFMVLTNEETEEFLADLDNFTRTTALAVIPRLHGSRLFFHGETPGEELTYGHSGWVLG